MELTIVSQLLAPLGHLGLRLLLLIAVAVAAVIVAGLMALEPAAPSLEPILTAPVRWVAKS